MGIVDLARFYPPPPFVIYFLPSLFIFVHLLISTVYACVQFSRVIFRSLCILLWWNLLGAALTSSPVPAVSLTLLFHE